MWQTRPHGDGPQQKENGVSRKPEFFIQNKEQLQCEHCGLNGHTMATCFKIHGYPDWYKSLKQSRQNTTIQANSAATSLHTPLDCVIDQETNQEDSTTNASYNTTDITTIIQREIAKYMSGYWQGELCTRKYCLHNLCRYTVIFYLQLHLPHIAFLRK